MKGIKLKNKADTRLFKLGEPFYSLDNGKTWKGGPTHVVTKVNHLTGTITIDVAP